MTKDVFAKEEEMSLRNGGTPKFVFHIFVCCWLKKGQASLLTGIKTFSNVIANEHHNN